MVCGRLRQTPTCFCVYTVIVFKFGLGLPYHLEEYSAMGHAYMVSFRDCTELRLVTAQQYLAAPYGRTRAIVEVLQLSSSRREVYQCVLANT
ncbi:hypothetical protein C2E23DRAFT_822109 [Lenzites betulinus]|nr:hypothetical protein C2E23DRAFT_822109 [Lenzites betulinus]